MEIEELKSHLIVIMSHGQNWIDIHWYFLTGNFATEDTKCLKWSRLQWDFQLFQQKHAIDNRQRFFPSIFLRHFPPKNWTKSAAGINPECEPGHRRQRPERVIDGPNELEFGNLLSGLRPLTFFVFISFFLGVWSLLSWVEFRCPN